jgi:hypothetical protein
MVNGPEGAAYEHISEHMTEVERRLMPLVENGEITRLLVRALKWTPYPGPFLPEFKLHCTP